MLTNKQISYLPYDDYAQSANTLFHFMTKPEIADSFSVAEALLTYLYSHDDNTPVENGKVSLSDVKRYFHCYESFLRRLNAIESKLFSAFETVEEAKHEENTILQHDEIYVNALTSNAYINQYYEE